MRKRVLQKKTHDDQKAHWRWQAAVGPDLELRVATERELEGHRLVGGLHIRGQCGSWTGRGVHLQTGHQRVELLKGFQ